MRTSYHTDDVILLLKDITGLVSPQPTPEREKLIQAGRHYCEMLPIEYVPTQEYMRVYKEALKAYAEQTAQAVENLAEKIMRARGKDVVLVSLARAGIPAGILLKRRMKQRFQLTAPHYAVSIIRGRGIDHNAMRYLLGRFAPQQLLFVDGWVGKGAILGELQKAAAAYEGVSPQLAVLADPAGVTGLCGTHEDILIPSSCLNSTVSGLISRTFLRDDIIGPDDFHGAVYYGELKDADLSYEFIDAIQAHFHESSGKAGSPGRPASEESGEEDGMEDTACRIQADRGDMDNIPPSGIPRTGMEEAQQIARALSVSSIHFVKPGIGETTRVLLRRVPWKILIGRNYKDSPQLRHIIRLAQEKNVPVEYYPLWHYKCCGIIKKTADA